MAAGTVWDYVVARTTIEYASELTQSDLGVVGDVALVRLGTTSVTAAITLTTSGGRVAAEVETVCVAIDRDGRRPRPLTDAERTALSA